MSHLVICEMVMALHTCRVVVKLWVLMTRGCECGKWVWRGGHVILHHEMKLCVKWRRLKMVASEKLWEHMNCADMAMWKKWEWLSEIDNVSVYHVSKTGYEVLRKDLKTKQQNYTHTIVQPGKKWQFQQESCLVSPQTKGKQAVGFPFIHPLC